MMSPVVGYDVYQLTKIGITQVTVIFFGTVFLNVNAQLFVSYKPF